MNWEIEKFNYQVEDEFNSLDQYDFDNETDTAGKYASIGLSINSQEKICEFHQILHDGNPDKIKIFEEILCSIIEDIQKYRKEASRLENSYKNERDKNQETIKNMIDEAERQLSGMSEKIKIQEQEKYMKIIDNLKQEYDAEIAHLQESLDKVLESEKKRRESQLDENSQIKELKNEIDSLNSENQDLRDKVRESQTEISILRTEIAELNNICIEKNSESYLPNEALGEILRLKQEITALHNANKRLNDTNDILKSAIQASKSKEVEIEKKLSMQLSPPKEEILSIIKRCSLIKHSSTFSSSFEHDEELDSGYLPSTTEISDFHNDSFYPNSSCSNFKYECQSTPINDSLDQKKFIVNISEDSHRTPNTNIAKPTSLNLNSKESISNTAVSKIKSPNNPDPERVFKVVFAGDSGVGKTSFIMRYCKGEFNPSTSSTIGVDHYMKVLDIDGKKIALQLWDTCGQERFRSIAKSYFRRADGVVLMYDCTYEKSYLNVREWVDIINESSDKRIPIILIGNKIDLREQMSEDNEVVYKEDGMKLARQYSSLFVETSAKDGSNIDDSLIEICRLMSINQDIELKSDRIRLGVSTPAKKKNCC